MLPEILGVAEHAMVTGHKINLDNVKIMACMPAFHQRITSEA